MSLLKRYVARVVLADTTCDGCTEVEISYTNQRQAGTFTACLAFSPAVVTGPFWDLLLSIPSPAGPDILLSLNFGEVDIVTGLTQWVTMMVGQVDHISMDPQNGLIEVDGRDLTARLIKLPSTQTFVNQTSSDIASALATAAELAQNVAPTTTIVGQFYQLEHSRSSLNTFTRFSTAFDIIALLAQLEGYDFWVSGTTLNFVPVQTSGPASLVIDVPSLLSNTSVATTIKSVRFDRRVAFDDDAQVTVKSWNSRQRVALEKVYSSASASGPSIVFVAPNLTDDTAQNKAKALYSDLIGHRRVVSCEMTGELTIMPRDIVQVVGSQGWDDSYVIDTVVRKMSAQRGFTQWITARAL